MDRGPDVSSGDVMGEGWSDWGGGGGGGGGVISMREGWSDVGVM